MSSAKRRRVSPEKNDDDEDSYVVEEVINKRVTSSGTTEFLLKWAGYPVDKATWEPEENVECADLIIEYNKKERMKREEKRRKEGKNDDAEQTTSAADESNDYRKKMPKTILGISKAPGELYFLVKFTDETAALLPAKEVNARWRPFVDEYVGFVQRALNRRQKRLSGKADLNDLDEEEPRLPPNYAELVEKHEAERNEELRKRQQTEAANADEVVEEAPIHMILEEHMDIAVDLAPYQVESLSNFAEIDESNDIMPPIFEDFENSGPSQIFDEDDNVTLI